MFMGILSPGSGYFIRTGELLTRIVIERVEHVAQWNGFVTRRRSSCEPAIVKPYGSVLFLPTGAERQGDT